MGNQTDADPMKKVFEAPIWAVTALANMPPTNVAATAY